MSSPVIQALQTALLLAVASVFGDGVHALLHVWARTRHPLLRPLRALARLHLTHHQFWDRQLVLHPNLWRANLLRHHLPETLMRSALTTTVGVVLGAPRAVVGAAVGVWLIDLGVVIARRGRDPLHSATPPLPVPTAGLAVDRSYHALHHAFPDHFHAAHLQLIDRAVGTMLPLAGRTALLVGATPLLAALGERLTRGGARILRCAPDAVDNAALADADILVLGHGSNARGDDAYEVLIGRARQARVRAVPLDVWTIGDDAAWRARASTLTASRVVLRRIRDERAHTGPWRERWLWARLCRGARIL